MVAVMDSTDRESGQRRGRGPDRRPRGRALPYLQAWRTARYLSQGELADKAGVARSTLARAERGDEVVGWMNIRRLADALDITPDELQREPASTQG